MKPTRFNADMVITNYQGQYEIQAQRKPRNEKKRYYTIFFALDAKSDFKGTIQLKYVQRRSKSVTIYSKYLIIVKRELRIPPTLDTYEQVKEYIENNRFI